jgi:hypothetical protein
MLKRYYTVEEAAKFLTSEYKQTVTQMDVLTLARHGDIRLCTWFDDELGLFRDHEDPDNPYWEEYGPYSFKGYIQISKDAITPNGGEIKFSPVDSIEIISYTGPPIAEVKFPYTFGSYTSNCDKAVIPAKDLLELRIKKSDLEKPLSSTERNSLLTIIGIMAKDGYGNDLTKPYELAKEIHSAAARLGIRISDDTIASKLKEAKNILIEKFE